MTEDSMHRTLDAAISRALAAAFWEMVAETTDCWLWTGPLNGSGYGQLRARGASLYAHRYSYELHVGPIPEGLVIDHLCRVRRCVNPTHLEAVTVRENTLRGVGPTAVNAARSECVRGHPFNEENTYQHPRGRGCKECSREDKRAERAARPKVPCPICGVPQTSQNLARHARRKHEGVAA